MASSVERVVFQMCSSAIVTVFISQSIRGLYFANQGIPRTTWDRPKSTIMSVKSSSKPVACMCAVVAAVIHPCLLTVPSILKACRAGMGRAGRRRRLMREGSIKFPVAPQSMRAVVVTVLALYHSLMGNRKGHSDLFATITEAISREEEDVTTSSCFKKTAPQFRRPLLQFSRGIITQQVSFLSLLSLSHISLSLPPPMSRWFILVLGFE